MYNFEFTKPTTVAEAAKAISDEGAQALGGGQTLLPTMKQRLAMPETLVSLTGIAEMVGVGVRGSDLTIGGATTHAQVAADAAASYPALETALDEDEIITSVTFPIPDAANYQKFEQPASRFALVGVFVAKTADGVRVAVTGASNGGVYRWLEAETALNSDFSAKALEGMSGNAADMIADLHGSADYRAHLVGVLTRRAVAACA